MKKLSFLFVAVALVAFSLSSCKTSTEPAEAEETVVEEVVEEAVEVVDSAAAEVTEEAPAE